jgi:hypothetical protein
MPQTLLQKLRIKPGNRIALINVSTPEPGLPDPFPGNVTVVGKLEDHLDQVHLFVATQTELERLAPPAIDGLNIDGLMWVYYPKGTSGIQTDLTRDKGWDVFKGTPMQFVNLISLDDTWSAFGLRKRGGEMRREPQKGVVDTTTRKYVDKEKRVVKAPADLAKALAKSKRAKTVFDHLSFTHKREYVEWILGAKQEVTRERRVKLTVERLVGKGSEKGKKE